MKDLKGIVGKILVAFVLVSIGYAAGRNVSVQKGGAVEKPGHGKSLCVYYVHANIRCRTCNNIEIAARRLLESGFSRELSDGRIVWKVVNFQKDEDFARKFDVSGSGVIAVLMDGDRVEGYEKLDKVWTLLGDIPAFNAYLETAFRKLMASGGVR